VSTIDILVPDKHVYSVHLLVAKRLSERGHDVALVGVQAHTSRLVLTTILRIERKLLRLRGHDLLEPANFSRLSQPRPEAALRIDMTGAMLQLASPSIRPGFVDGASIAEAARLLMFGQLPNIDIWLNGDTRIARAAPMVDSRLSLVRGLNDILARMVTLLVSTADRYLKGEITKPLSKTLSGGNCPTTAQMLRAYVFSAIPRGAGSAARRLGLNVNRWRISYRFHGGRTVAATGLLAGEPWRNLPDDGRRFYADPFAFEWQARHFIFVEEFRDGATKAVISVAEVFRDGAPTTPRTVLEEPYHLSYPQVFDHGGETWMLPEGGSGGNLVLYRAASFPDHWVRHAILVANRELFDATLLEHEGRLWLFASERDGFGSASDTLVVYHAPKLEGPWVPHASNPVRIDRAAARPGGGFVRTGDRIVLPMQDGTEGYGGGLGLADLIQLDERVVKLSQPVPILAPTKHAYPKVHTLNNSDQLEVVDYIAPLVRGPVRRKK
jgi:hypothetical protein